ncbi:MAG: serine/threonine protein kinase [Pirellulales bacterium]|nr:serine/threonine protein kinase [Pirellulales bacterium]
MDDDGLDDPTVTTPGDSKATSSKPPERLPPNTLPTVGSVVDHYEIIGEIARGAMGVVYQAKHLPLDRIVALKMVADGGDASDDHLLRFENEARAAAALDHPGIVPVYEVGLWGQCPYFAMAYVDGESLAAVLREGPLPPRRAAEIAREVSEAIGHAHDHQIIHRDLKPANILIDHNGAARVADFGVSKTLGNGCELTQRGELVGTPHYMPPEQSGSSKAVGPTADVYSIGAVLYAMLTGRPPFQAASPVDVVAQVISQPPVAPSALNASVPLELEVITLKCLSKRTGDRYASAQELALDLARFLAGEPISARPPGWLRRGRSLLRQHVIFASVSGTTALLLVLTTAAVFFSLLSAQRSVAKLTEQLRTTTQLLETERRAVARFISRTQADPEDDNLLAFDVDRLAESAQQQAESNPDLAAQLALAVIDLAIEGGQPAPAEMVELLKHQLSSETPPDNESEAVLPTSDALVIEAARQIVTPLSESDRKLFGIQPLGQLTTEQKEKSDE